MDAMPSVKFFALAYRITAYQGVMKQRMEEQLATEAATAASAVRAAPVRREPPVPDASPQAMLHQPPEIAELFSFGGV